MSGTDGADRVGRLLLHAVNPGSGTDIGTPARSDAEVNDGYIGYGSLNRDESTWG